MRRGPVRRSLGEGGFTLVEILVVIVVLAILTGIGFGMWSSVEHSKSKVTDGRLDTLGFRIRSDISTKGWPPKTLAELADAMGNPTWMEGGKFIDGWDRPIEYRVDGKKFRLWSCGPDGVSGSPDDHEYSKR